MEGTDILVSPGESPFDALRHTDPTGREYWLGRDLMPHLGYDRWENFAEAVGRARAACANAKQQVERNFRGVTKSSIVRDQLTGRTRNGPGMADVELSRFGAYLVSMNGDPRKPQVAAAQSYFATATRWAETAQRTGFDVPKNFAEALELAAKQQRELEAANERARKALALAQEHEKLQDEAVALAKDAAEEAARLDTRLTATLGELGAALPKVDAYNAFLDGAGAFPLATSAQLLDTGRQRLIDLLCRWRVLMNRPGHSDHLRPYQEHLDAGRFVVKSSDVPIQHRDGTKEVITRGTTLVTPKGLDYIRARRRREELLNAQNGRSVSAG